MFRVFLFFFCAVLFVSAYPALAQTSIAIVDVEKVLNEAKAAKVLNKKRASAREKFLEVLNKEEQALRDEGKKLFEKRGDLSEEELAKQNKAFQEKQFELRKSIQKQKYDFDKASAKSLSLLQDKLAETVRKIADEKDFGLVLSNRDVIAGEKSLDITDDVIKRMDAQKIKIPFDVK